VVALRVAQERKETQPSLAEKVLLQAAASE
jgi:hypothetical protein